MMALTADAGTLSIENGLEMGTKLISWVLDTISSNEILGAVLVVGLLIPAGVGIFYSIKGAVR